MDIRKVNKILYDKEPEVHDFFVDFEKNRFYKCWTKQYKDRYDQEVEVYNMLSGSIHVIPMHDYYETGQYYIMEMEFIPYPALVGYTVSNTEWGHKTFSREQRDSIVEQLDVIHNDITNAALTNTVLDGTHTIGLGTQNLIYDSENDLLYFCDFEYEKGGYSIDAVKNSIGNLPNGEPTTRKLTKEDVLKNLISTTGGKFASGGYVLGEDLIKDIDAQPPGTVYQPVFINGHLMKGQVPPLYERLDVIRPRQEDFIDKEVVDIGCNIGDFLIYSANCGSSRVVGIEPLQNQNRLANKYINYMRTTYPQGGIYDNIIVEEYTAHAYDYGSADTILYFACWKHFGNPKFHEQLCSNASVIYFGGHGMAGEKEDMEKALRDFKGFEWEYLGSFDEAWECRGNPRPVFRGVRK